MSAARTDLFLFGDVMDHIDPRQVVGHRFSAPLGALVLGNDDGLLDAAVIGIGFG